MENKLDMPTEYWYGKLGAIDHCFWGVFEGGGAKGVAYNGALQAMAEKKCWFRGVAGASAGAITAALVASGLSPEDLESATDTALKHVQTGIWAGLRRLKKTTGYFPSDGLRGWLNDHLARQLARKTGAAPGTAAVTFQELYTATRIELNVVAADLSLRRQIVFSHNETPNCAVADAVIASSSLPFAFASCLLQVGDIKTGERVSHHTIVDGGVWSNFPAYIFEDKAFRRFYKRVPEKIESRRILGFLLKEDNERASLRGEEITFVESISLSDFRPVEWSRDKRVDVATRSGLVLRMGSWLLYPFYLLGRLIDWNSGVERGRWPTPSSRLTKYLVHSVNGLLGGINPLLFGILACAIVAIGVWEVASGIVAEQIRVIPATDWAQPSAYISRPVCVILGLLGLAIAILVLFVTILTVITNYILLRASRRILYGLVTTYVAGPGAREWVVERGNVVNLPIPATVKTLSFDMETEQRRGVITAARQATLAKLADLLSDERGSA